VKGQRVSRGFAIFVAMVTVLFLGEWLAPHAAPFEAPGVGVLASLAKLASQVTGAVFAGRCAARYEVGNAARRGWTLMSAWLACWFAGQAVLAFYARVLGRDAPVPSLGDLFFTAGYVFVIVALFTFVHAYRTSGFAAGSVRQDLFIALGACVVFGVVGGWLLWPIAVAPTPLLERFVNVGDPTLDFVALVPALILWRITLGFRGGKVSRPWAALLAGIAFALVTDIAYSDVSPERVAAVGPLVDLFGILGYAYCAYGTWLQYQLLTE
jgi:hypothetical protein